MNFMFYFLFNVFCMDTQNRHAPSLQSLSSGLKDETKDEQKNNLRNNYEQFTKFYEEFSKQSTNIISAALEQFNRLKKTVQNFSIYNLRNTILYLYYTDFARMKYLNIKTHDTYYDKNVELEHTVKKMYNELIDAKSCIDQLIDITNDVSITENKEHIYQISNKLYRHLIELNIVRACYSTCIDHILNSNFNE